MMDIEEVFFVHTHVSIRNHHLSVELSCKTSRWSCWKQASPFSKHRCGPISFASSLYLSDPIEPYQCSVSTQNP